MNSEVIVSLYFDVHFQTTSVFRMFLTTLPVSYVFLIKWSQRLTGKLTHATLAVQLCPLEYELYKRGYKGRAAKCSERSSNTWRCSPRLNQGQTQLDPEAGEKKNQLSIRISSARHAVKYMLKGFKSWSDGSHRGESLPKQW